MFIGLALILSSCHRHKCKNTNPIFNQYSPDDNEYKVELIKQLKQRDPADIHYYVDKYTERGGKPFMTISIQADGLCAKGILDIKNENKLKEFKNVKGLTYSGNEISKLQYYIDSTFGTYNFIFEEGEIIR